MGISKVEFAGEVLIDLTNDTVTAETTLAGYTGHGADGEPFSGNVDLSIYATTAYVDGQVDAIESSISTLSQTVSTQGESITSLQSQVSSNDTDISNLQQTTTTQGQNITTLQGQVSTLNQTTTTQGESITGLQSEVSAINTALESVARRTLYTASLSTSWSGSSAPFNQTVTVNGILASDTPHITPVFSANNDTAITELEAWAMVNKAVTNSGSITFTCFKEKPTTAINLQIEVIR